MSLRLYDTRSRTKRIFEPLVDGEVGIYVCGITPYSPSHIGHARQALAFDIIVRWLRYSGFKVNHITNFTDIDDKIIAIANEEKKLQDIHGEKFKNYVKSTPRLIPNIFKYKRPKTGEKVLVKISRINGVLIEVIGYLFLYTLIDIIYFILD